MKKLVSLLMLVGLVFTSCQKEDMNSDAAINGSALKAKIKQEKSQAEGSTEDDNCETAFGRYCECASQNTCFSDFDGITRWGWSVELNSYKTYRFNLFAGAGQCELDKGEYAGYVNVTFNSDGSVT